MQTTSGEHLLSRVGVLPGPSSRNPGSAGDKTWGYPATAKMLIMRYDTTGANHGACIMIKKERNLGQQHHRLPEWYNYQISRLLRSDNCLLFRSEWDLLAIYVQRFGIFVKGSPLGLQFFSLWHSGLMNAYEKPIVSSTQWKWSGSYR